MSEIDFQNGFLCGMATRGMISSGQTYNRYIEVIVSDAYNIPNNYGYFSDVFASQLITDETSSIADTFDLTSFIQGIINTDEVIVNV